MSDESKIIRTTDPIVIRMTEKNKEQRRKHAIQEFRKSVDQVNREYRIQTAKFHRKWLSADKTYKIRVHQVLSNGLWRGRRCFILGGGTSLQGFNFNLLRGEKVIAVNRAYEFAPFADIMLSMDSRYYQWITKGELGEDAKTKFLQFKGLKIFVDTMDFPYKEVITVTAIDRLGLSWDLKKGIYHGNNSGYSALQLAIALKASPIYLLGFDFYHQGNRAHFHSGYPNKGTEKMTRSYIKDFEHLSRELTIAQNKIKIINLNPKSSLRCFPIMRREEIRYHGSNHHH
jgi:hypothetical protein